MVEKHYNKPHCKEPESRNGYDLMEAVYFSLKKVGQEKQAEKYKKEVHDAIKDPNAFGLDRNYSTIRAIATNFVDFQIHRLGSVKLQTRTMTILYIECPHCGETIEDLDHAIPFATTADGPPVMECPNCKNDIQVINEL